MWRRKDRVEDKEEAQEAVRSAQCALTRANNKSAEATDIVSELRRQRQTNNFAYLIHRAMLGEEEIPEVDGES